MERGAKAYREERRRIAREKTEAAQQCPSYNDFRPTHYDQLGREYVHLVANRWGVRRARGRPEVVLPTLGEQLEIIRLGTVETRTLVVDNAENFKGRRRATMTLICREL